MNDGIEEPKRREYFSAEELDGGWLSWDLKDPTRFNSFIEPLTVRAEPPTRDGRPCARVRMVPERKHSNLGDNVHGAVTLALVDIALFGVGLEFARGDEGVFGRQNGDLLPLALRIVPAKLSTIWLSPSPCTTRPRRKIRRPVSRTSSTTASKGSPTRPAPTNWVDRSSVTEWPALSAPN